MLRCSVHSRFIGRSHWAAVAFLFTFTLLLIAICYFYLFPALEAYKHASPEDRSKLRAYSALVQAIMLFILVAGLILTVRIGRFFFPRPDSPRVRTQYVDAWAEAGKRAETPKPEEDSEDAL
jgi:O-antigen/teichoic acid export membrane protein